MRRSLAVAFITVSLGCSRSDPGSSPAAEEAAKAAPSVLPDKPAPAETVAPPPALTAPAPPSAVAQAEQVPAATPKPPAAALAGAGASAAPSVAALTSAAPAPSIAPSAPPALPAAPPPASAAAEVKSVMSPKTTEPSFNLWMQSAGKYKAGQQGAVQVVLVAKGDYHCNDKYPYKFKLGAAPAGVSYPQPVVRAEAMSITPDRSMMSIPVLPAAAGEARVGGTFFFSVCNASTCKIESRDLSLNIKID